MNKICGYTCEHNKGGICQLTMCDKRIVMATTTNEPFEKRFNVKYDEQGVENFARWLEPTIEEYGKEIERLNNIINTMLEFDFFKNNCPLDFSYTEKCDEDEAQNVFYEDAYCEENCTNEFKKCWLKYFERLQELKGSDSNE